MRFAPETLNFYSLLVKPLDVKDFKSTLSLNCSGFSRIPILYSLLPSSDVFSGYSNCSSFASSSVPSIWGPFKFAHLNSHTLFTPSAICQFANSNKSSLTLFKCSEPLTGISSSSLIAFKVCCAVSCGSSPLDILFLILSLMLNI